MNIRYTNLFKQLPLSFTFGVSYLSTHFGVKLSCNVDGFLIISSDIHLAVHVEMSLTFPK